MIRRDIRVAGFLAARSITRGNAGVTAMAIAMVAAVFVSIMFLPSLIAGASTSIESQITDTLTGDLVVTGADRKPIENADAYLAQVRAADGIAAATPLRVVGNQIAHGDDFNAWTVTAVDPTSYSEVFTTPQHLIEGEWLEPDDVEGIVLGVGIAGADQTQLRTYRQSLKSVHVGDTVSVSLLGGGTQTFTVRGVYANDFALTDQGAYVTLAAADQAIPQTDPAEQIEGLYEGLDTLGRSLGEMSDQAAALSEGLDAMGTAAGSLADGASGVAGGMTVITESTTSLDGGAAGVDAGAANIAEGASDLAGGVTSLDEGIVALEESAWALAAAAQAVADNAHNLADALSGAASSFETEVLTSATLATEQANIVAADAQAALADCPEPTSEYCQRIADLAAHARTSAAAAAVTQEAVTVAATDVTSLADSAAALASGADDIASAAARLAEGATTLAVSSSALTSGAGNLVSGSLSVAAGSAALADSADSLSSAVSTLRGSTLVLSDGAQTFDAQMGEVAGGGSSLADALDEAAESVPSGSESERDDLLALFDFADPLAADTASTIVVIGDEWATADDLVAAIEPLSPGMEFHTPEQLSLSIQDQLDTFELINSIMQVISLLVAAITVFIITYVDLNNRRRQIGIERAIGIRATSIVTSYVFKSILTGIAGAAVGFTLFRFVIVPVVERYPFVFPNGPVTLEVSGQSMFSAALILLLVSAASAVVPAIQTVRMRILDAIWG